MSVRHVKRRDRKTGEVRTFLMVDVVFEHPDGRTERVRKVSPVQTKRGAEQYERDLRQAILGGQRQPEVKAKENVPTLGEFAPEFIEGYAKANQEKPSTIHSKEAIIRTYLVPRFGGKRLDQIETVDVQRLKGSLQKLKPKTVNNVLSCLLTLFKTAVEWGVVENRPTVKLLKVPKTEVAFYEPEEYERLVEAAGAIDPRLEIMVLLGGDAGLRSGEIIAVEWSDIDFKRGLLKVQRSEWRGQVTVPKGGRSRQVKLTDRLLEKLRAHRNLRVRVLSRDGGDQVTRQVLSGWMATAQRRANLKETGALHILRHTFCSRLALLGAPTMAIKELAGHQDISTTQKYMHLSPAAKESAIALLNGATEQVYGNLTATQTTKAGNP